MAHSSTSFRTLPKGLPGSLTSQSPQLLQFIPPFPAYFFFLLSCYNYATNYSLSCLWPVFPTRMKVPRRQRFLCVFCPRYSPSVLLQCLAQGRYSIHLWVAGLAGQGCLVTLPALGHQTQTATISASEGMTLARVKEARLPSVGLGLRRGLWRSPILTSHPASKATALHPPLCKGKYLLGWLFKKLIPCKPFSCLPKFHLISYRDASKSSAVKESGKNQLPL